MESGAQGLGWQLPLSDKERRLHMMQENSASRTPDVLVSDKANDEFKNAQLWTKWIDEKDIQAREQLMQAFLPYARVVAATYYARRIHNEIEFDEYLQLASLGLVESIDRYDPSFGVQFKTFAAKRMQGSILNGLERLTEKNQQIAVKRRLRQERVEAAKSAALENIGPSLQPSNSKDPQLSSRTTKEDQALFAYLAEVGIGLALGVMLEGTGMVNNETVSPNAGVASAEASYFKQSELQRLHRILTDFVASLPAQERMVIRYHYLQEIPFDEIGNMMGVKRSRVSQIHQKALGSLRQALTRQSCDLSL
jgi:RNA polymerase sigma factor FliA